MYWHLVADSKAVFFSNYDVGRREEPVLRMGTGGSEEQRKLRSQQVRGQLSWPSLTTASISRRPKSLLNPTINVLETAWRAPCTGELHVGISWPWEEQVWCRQAGRGGEELPPVTARNLLTKCYNFFTMVRSENESFSANQKGKLWGLDQWESRLWQVYPLWQGTGRLEIAVPLGSFDGPAPGTAGFLGYLVDRKPTCWYPATNEIGEQGLIQYQLVLPGYMDTINVLTNTKNRS